MNTTENNKLIAEFMELPFIVTDAGTNYIKSDLHCPDYELDYHTDWNWLMEVVEKIESLGFKTSIEPNHFSIDGNETYFETKTFNTPKLQAVYDAVFEFIKWYNETAGKEIKTVK